jgi:hypothetical protein
MRLTTGTTERRRALNYWAQRKARSLHVRSTDEQLREAVLAAIKVDQFTESDQKYAVTRLRFYLDQHIREMAKVNILL